MQTQMTGYMIFCQEQKESMEAQHPDYTITKLNMKLANAWRALPAGTKRAYSCRARNYDANGTKKSKTSHQKQQPPPAEEQIHFIAFCCAWGRCDFQFEAVDECAQHIQDMHLRHLCLIDTETLKAPTNCCWRGCLRQKRCALPFVQFSRLYRHMSEEHVLIGKSLNTSERSQNYIPVSHFD